MLCLQGGLANFSKYSFIEKPFLLQTIDDLDNMFAALLVSWQAEMATLLWGTGYDGGILGQVFSGFCGEDNCPWKLNEQVGITQKPEQPPSKAFAFDAFVA